MDKEASEAHLEGKNGEQITSYSNSEQKKVSCAKEAKGQQTKKSKKVSTNEAENCQGLVLKMKLAKTVIALLFEISKVGVYLHSELPPTFKLRIINRCKIEEVDTQN